MRRAVVHHLAFTVRDLAASEAAFYGPLLDFLGYENAGGAPRMVIWRALDGSSAVHLIQAEDGVAVPEQDHCAFAMESRRDVDDLYALLSRHGVTIAGPPAEYPRFAPGYYAIFFNDPDGRLFEVLHVPS